MEISEELLEAFRKLNKTILEGMEMPKVRTGQYKAEWNKETGRIEESYTVDPTIWDLCLDCGQPNERHANGKCPTIIDAEFVKEEPKQLPPGKKE
jgi:hypothetical protein